MKTKDIQQHLPPVEIFDDPSFCNNVIFNCPFLRRMEKNTNKYCNLFNKVRIVDSQKCDPCKSAYKKAKEEENFKEAVKRVGEKLKNMPVDETKDTTRLDSLPQSERKEHCYCKEKDDTHCGVCKCGKLGHLRAYMFGTFEWCDDCFEKMLQEENGENEPEEDHI